MEFNHSQSISITSSSTEEKDVLAFWVDVPGLFPAIIAVVGFQFLIHAAVYPLFHHKNRHEKIHYLCGMIARSAVGLFLILAHHDVITPAACTIWGTAVFLGNYVFDLGIILSRWSKLIPMFRGFYLFHHGVNTIAVIIPLIAFKAANNYLLVQASLIWHNLAWVMYGWWLVKLTVNPPWWNKVKPVAMCATLGVSLAAYLFYGLQCSSTSFGCWYVASLWAYIGSILMNVIDTASQVQSMLKGRKRNIRPRSADKAAGDDVTVSSGREVTLVHGNHHADSA
eukprot:jgi/Chrzof1/2938/Cz12g05050.t1